MNSFLNIQKDTVKAYRIILSILLVEILIYFFCDIHIASFVDNSFIAFEQDPLLWIIYFTGLPKLIISNIYLSCFIDAAILILLATLILKPFNSRIGLLLFILMLLFYAIFTAHLAHRNYQSGYLLVLLPLLFSNINRKQIVFEFTRYFILFFYISAAYFKITSGSLFSNDHFSNAIINQFTPYFLEQSYSVRTNINLFLITHSSVTSFLYIGATLLELSAFIGFFTKRFDTYLAIFILLFHFTNWFIMDIAPIGQIAFICTLFFSKKLSWKT